jgi:hypothetical protein
MEMNSALSMLSFIKGRLASKFSCVISILIAVVLFENRKTPGDDCC